MDAATMTDAELDILIEELRVAASAWFNDKLLMKLEALIRETKCARADNKSRETMEIWDFE
jgi:hypothetical protein